MQRKDGSSCQFFMSVNGAQVGSTDIQTCLSFGSSLHLFTGASDYPPLSGYISNVAFSPIAESKLNQRFLGFRQEEQIFSSDDYVLVPPMSNLTDFEDDIELPEDYYDLIEEFKGQ